MALDRSSHTFLPAREAGFAVERQTQVLHRKDLLLRTLGNVQHAIPHVAEQARHAVETAGGQAMKLVERVEVPETPAATQLDYPTSALEAAKQAVEDAFREAA